MHARRIIPALIVSAAALVVLAPHAQAQDTLSEYAAAAFNDESPIIVTESRATEDEAINRNVVEILSNDSRLAGRIGVQTTDREVELTGIVTGPGMMRVAERDAKSVSGVRNVRNLMSTRIGGGRY